MKTLFATLICLMAALAFAEEPATPADPLPSPEPTPAPNSAAASSAKPADSQAAVENGSTESQPSMSLEQNPAGEGASLFSDPAALEKSGPDGTDPLALPPLPEPEPARPNQPVFRKSRTSAASEEMRQRIQLRQAKTRAFNTPDVQAALERVEAAATFPEQLEAMRDYYTALYNRMERLDPSLKKPIAELRRQNLRRLESERIVLPKKSRASR